MLSVHPDGYGYLVYENGDSVYVPTRRMRWLEIAPGDRIVADLMPPRSEKAHPMLAEIRTRNGAEFDYSKLYNGPSKMTELLLQLFYYLVVSFVMLSILTSVRRNYSMSRFVRVAYTKLNAVWQPLCSIAWRPSRSGIRAGSC